MRTPSRWSRIPAVLLACQLAFAPATGALAKSGTPTVPSLAHEVVTTWLVDLPAQPDRAFALRSMLIAIFEKQPHSHIARWVEEHSAELREASRVDTTPTARGFRATYGGRAYEVTLEAEGLRVDGTRIEMHPLWDIERSVRHLAGAFAAPTPAAHGVSFSQLLERWSPFRQAHALDASRINVVQPMGVLAVLALAAWYLYDKGSLMKQANHSGRCLRDITDFVVQSTPSWAEYWGIRAGLLTTKTIDPEKSAREMVSFRVRDWNEFECDAHPKSEKCAATLESYRCTVRAISQYTPYQTVSMDTKRPLPPLDQMTRPIEIDRVLVPDGSRAPAGTNAAPSTRRAR